LLRREYYDPNDKPGMAEVIVAKNRHGSVGSVHLSFIRELVQFRNYTPIQVDVGAESPFAEFKV
jgi:replicative DNA helicase